MQLPTFADEQQLRRNARSARPHGRALLGGALVAAALITSAPGTASAATFCDAPPWSCTNLSALASAPRSYSPEPWVRGDGVSSVVSYGDGGSIRELALENGQWRAYDLLAAIPGHQPRGIMPRGYVRSDGISAVTYTGTEDAPDEVQELTLVGGQWKHGNLHRQTHTTGAPGVASGSGTQGYVRADGVSAVVYLGKDGHIHEFTLKPGVGWLHADLTVASGAPSGSFAVNPVGRPQAFTRSDGTTAVIYLSGDGEIRQLKLGKTGPWRHNLLSDNPGDPKAYLGLAAYVRTDKTNAIVYQGVDKHIHEMTLDATGEWVMSDLTLITGAPPADIGSVTAYNRGDGISTVVYSSGQRVQELALKGRWRHNDLTLRLSAPNGFGPRGYVRSDGTTAIVQNDIGPIYGIREFALNTQ
jgi:hypothetical protein